MLSISGNDFLEGMPKFHNQDAILAEMLLDTDRILQPLFQEFPDVHVYHYGYEIMNWSVSPHCETYAYNELGTICKRGYLDKECCIKTQRNFLQTLFVDALAAKYAGNRSINYHAVNLLGTLQARGGVPGAETGKPVLTQYSPAQYVRSDSSVWGCVHLTKPDYTVLWEAMAKQMGFTGPASSPGSASANATAIASALAQKSGASMCCSGPGQCNATQHCDYAGRPCGIGTGQCADGKPCMSAEFQNEQYCPQYCNWTITPVPGTPGIGECIPIWPTSVTA